MTSCAMARLHKCDWTRHGTATVLGMKLIYVKFAYIYIYDVVLGKFMPFLVRMTKQGIKHDLIQI